MNCEKKSFEVGWGGWGTVSVSFCQKFNAHWNNAFVRYSCFHLGFYETAFRKARLHIDLPLFNMNFKPIFMARCAFVKQNYISWRYNSLKITSTFRSTTLKAGKKYR